MTINDPDDSRETQTTTQAIPNSPYDPAIPA